MSRPKHVETNFKWNIYLIVASSWCSHLSFYIGKLYWQCSCARCDVELNMHIFWAVTLYKWVRKERPETDSVASHHSRPLSSSLVSCLCELLHAADTTMTCRYCSKWLSRVL